MDVEGGSRRYSRIQYRASDSSSNIYTGTFDQYVRATPAQHEASATDSHVDVQSVRLLPKWSEYGTRTKGWGVNVTFMIHCDVASDTFTFGSALGQTDGTKIALAGCGFQRGSSRQ